MKEDRLRATLQDFLDTCSMDEVLWVMLAFSRRFSRFARFVDLREGKSGTASLTIRRNSDGGPGVKRDDVDNMIDEIERRIDERKNKGVNGGGEILDIAM